MSCVLCVVGYVYIIYAITTGKMSFTHQETTCWSWLQFGFSIATFDFLAIRCTLDRKNKIAGTPRVRGIELKTLASQGEHPPYQQRGLSAGWAISPPTMATTTTMLPPFFSASSAEQPWIPTVCRVATHSAALQQAKCSGTTTHSGHWTRWRKSLTNIHSDCAWIHISPILCWKCSPDTSQSYWSYIPTLACVFERRFNLYLFLGLRLCLCVLGDVCATVYMVAADRILLQ